MSLPTRDREIWALALWTERQHGENAPRVVAEKIGAFAAGGEQGAVDMWRGVAKRLDQLIADRASAAH